MFIMVLSILIMPMGTAKREKKATKQIEKITGSRHGLDFLFIDDITPDDYFDKPISILTDKRGKSKWFSLIITGIIRVFTGIVFWIEMLYNRNVLKQEVCMEKHSRCRKEPF